MRLTEEHLDIASAAAIAAAEGRGLVLADHAYPAAHELAEAGWLERYFGGGELCWRWSRQADTALALGNLITDHQGAN